MVVFELLFMKINLPTKHRNTVSFSTAIFYQTVTKQVTTEWKLVIGSQLRSMGRILPQVRSKSSQFGSQITGSQFAVRSLPTPGWCNITNRCITCVSRPPTRLTASANLLNVVVAWSAWNGCSTVANSLISSICVEIF